MNAVVFFSLSTVMEHIRALEQELGTSLFYSQGRKLIPTLAGERFRVHAQSIMQTYQNALVETMTFSQNKKLRIITVETLGLYFLNTPLLKLIQTYPEIDLSVSFVPASESQDLLRRETADIAILFSGQPWDTIPATGLRQEILCQDESVFFTNPNSCLAKKPGLHIEDLLDAKFILTRKDGLYSGHLARIFKDTGVRIVPMQYIDSGHLLKQFVRLAAYCLK